MVLIEEANKHVMIGNPVSKSACADVFKYLCVCACINEEKIYGSGIVSGFSASAIHTKGFLL